MERIEDTPELFGRGNGISTCGDFTCAICGTRFNDGNDAAEHYEDAPIPVTDFAGVQVCGFCFGAVEREILSRMPDIIPWYKRRLAAQQAKLNAMQQELSNGGL